MNAQSLIKIFDYNSEVILTQMQGITHEESLVQPVTDGHSLNWLLGHILSSRTIPYQRVQVTPPLDETTRPIYRGGSVPDGDLALPIEQLVALFTTTHAQFIAGLAGLTGGYLAGHSGYDENSMYESFQYFHFHEIYHIGQMTQVAAHLKKPMAYIRL